MRAAEKRGPQTEARSPDLKRVIVVKIRGHRARSVQRLPANRQKRGPGGGGGRVDRAIVGTWGRRCLDAS